MPAAPKKLSLTQQARLCVYYLAGYLTTDPTARERLEKLYKKETGEALQRTVLWRHLTLRVIPSGEFLLFYLKFLHREKAIAPDPEGKSLFVYSHPELLKAKQ